MRIDLDSKSLTTVLEQVADFSLSLDAKNRVRHLAIASDELDARFLGTWKGKSWLGTTDASGRERLQQLLDSVRARPGQVAHADVVHPLPDGSEMPAQYRAILPDGSDQVLVFGHDLRPTANLRQQLANAQQALEQDYWRLRQVETRYRGLFDMVEDAMLVVDVASGRVLEANPAANKLLAGDKSIVGKPLQQALEKRSARAVGKLLEETRTLGKGSLAGIRVNGSKEPLYLSVSFMRQGEETRYLVRITGHEGGESVLNGARFMQEALRMAPDAVLLTDTDGRVLAANRMFLELAQLASEEPAIGQSADRWLGGPALT